MKTVRSMVSAAVAALVCACPVSAAESPPAINLAVMQSYSGGTSAIAGSTSFSKEGTAYCAPDVPYVNWYVSQLNSPRRPQYLLSRYTRTAPVGKDGSFTCGNLARGRYVVWIEGDRRAAADFSGQPVSDEVSSDKGPMNVTKVSYGSDSASNSARFFTAPKHVVVGRGTLKVRI
jgi:hypothetical protein